MEIAVPTPTTDDETTKEMVSTMETLDAPTNRVDEKIPVPDQIQVRILDQILDQSRVPFRECRVQGQTTVFQL
jgi:hypothetical protein